MRILENYNRQNNKKLTAMVGACMRNLGVCYLVIHLIWLRLLVMSEGPRPGILKLCFLPMLLPLAVYVLYHFLILRTEIELHCNVTYLILNIYVIVLLSHPSRILILDGLLIGVIAMFPLWTDQKWAKAQAIVFLGMIVARHGIIWLTGYHEVGNWYLLSLLGMCCIGVLVYCNVKFVHNQTMLLGDATRMDAATGLYNHEYFYEELERRMKKFSQLPVYEREENTYCLLVADIDNFKRVNDTYGHAFGDEVLIGLAQIFKNYCGSKDFAARYGGEEFVLIIGGCKKSDALTRANTIRKRFASTIFTDANGEDHQFTISLGVAEYNKPWDTASKFFDQADKALYEAKNSGKNRVCAS